MPEIEVVFSAEKRSDGWYITMSTQGGVSNGPLGTPQGPLRSRRHVMAIIELFISSHLDAAPLVESTEPIVVSVKSDPFQIFMNVIEKRITNVPAKNSN